MNAPSRSQYSGISRSEIPEDLSVKVKPFNSKEADWYAYRTHFEGMAQMAGWSNNTKVTRLMGALQVCLPGITAGLPQPLRYEILLARVDSAYGLSNIREDASLKLQGCRMNTGENETVPMFAERVRQLVFRAYPHFSQCDRDEQALRVFLQGLPSKHDFRLTMRSQKFSSFNEASTYGTRLYRILRDEKMNDGMRSVPTRGAQREDSEMFKLCEKLCKEVSELRALQAEAQSHGVRKETPSPLTKPCLVCREYGHWCKDCPLVVTNIPEYQPSQE